MSDEPKTTPDAVIYKDDDLVYVNPQAKCVVGMVEFDASGKPKPKPLPSLPSESETAEENSTSKKEGKPTKGTRRPRALRIRYCPWGTYRSMKRVFKLEGKPPRVESQKTLDEVMEKALVEPFWD